MPANSDLHETIRKVIRDHITPDTVVFFVAIPVSRQMLHDFTAKQLAMQLVPEAGEQLTKQIMVAKQEVA